MNFERLCFVSPVLENICSHLEFKEIITLKKALKWETLPCQKFLTDKYSSRRLLISEINPVTIDLCKYVRNYDFDLALKMICLNDKLPGVLILLQCSFSQEVLTEALISAGLSGSEDLLSILLEKGANINGQSSAKITCLMNACYNGHTPTVKFLLERGADPTLLDGDDYDALYRAANYNYFEIVEMLLATGKIKNIRSALSKAILSSKLEMVKLLVNTGMNLNSRDRNGFTPLINAIYHCQPQIVELLLERGVDSQKPTWNGFTPLEIVKKCMTGNNLKTKKKEGFLQILKLLETHQLSS